MLCLRCYDLLREQYGSEQMARREWLLERLQEARAIRQQRREFETRRIVSATGDMLDTAAAASGAVIGSAASLSVRGLGALASGARQGAAAAWGAARRPRQAPFPPEALPPGIHEEFEEAQSGGFPAAAAEERQASQAPPKTPSLPSPNKQITHLFS